MIIGIPRETDPSETRVALIPTAVEKLVKKGCEVLMEPSAGTDSLWPDDAYVRAGARTCTRAELFAQSDCLLRVRSSGPADIQLMKRDACHISFFDPFHNRAELELFARQGITLISLELIPRTTIAQKFDALSSQANLAGYAAVIIAAERSRKIFPMMMTPAGTIAPSRVLVIGAGVAGLQAIATAKRLGARVEAYDTRPVVEEQVKSLGAKFLKIDVGDTGQTQDGYAKALTAEQLERQRQSLAKFVAQADIVVTTAQVFGKKAPVIITRDMVQGMAPGSILVDLAVESGGNIEGVVPGEETVINGVRLVGIRNLPGRVAHHASQMFSQNLLNFIETFWDQDAASLKIDLGQDILKACVLTQGGAIVQKSSQPATQSTDQKGTAHGS